MGEEGEGAGQEGEEGEKGLLSEPLIIIFQSDLTPMQDAKAPTPPAQVASPAQSPALLPTTI